VAALVVLCVALVVTACGPALRPGVRTTLPTNRGSSALLPGASIAPTLAGVVEPPKTGAYIGVYQPPAPFSLSGLDAYAQISNKAPAILMWYQPWSIGGPRDFDPASVVSLYERNIVPMVTWEPWNPGTNASALPDPSNQPAYRLANINAGKFDLYIHTFARAVKSVRGPVMIRLMHEMNGNWYPWSGTANGNTPAEFITAWRHVHDIFVAEGATNVTWVWSINHESVPPTLENSYAAYYPGDAYVDWVSISGFNWGTSLPTTAWRPLNFWYATPMAFLKSTGKPIIVSEFGSVENGGDKAGWIGDAYHQFQFTYPEVKAVVYYDKLESQHGAVQDWRVTSSPAALRSYQAAVGTTYFLPAPATTLATWMQGLTPANWIYLRTLRPVY
jgi:hypothetical protein